MQKRWDSSVDWISKIGPLEGAYTERLLTEVDYVVRTAARWNGNRLWETQFTVVSTDVNAIATAGFGNATEKSAQGFAGMTYIWGSRTGIWLKPGPPREESIDTALHEWAHGVTSSYAGHDVSWRRVYGLSLHLWQVMYPKYPLKTSPCLRVKSTIGSYTEVWHNGGESYDEYQERCRKERRRICSSAQKMCLQLGFPGAA